jgi:DNA-binding NarL/FixJ family response regulator
MRIKVLLVDDHAIVREGIRSLLQLQDDIDIVGEAGTGDEAILRNRELRPDVIVMDISMAPVGGVEATRRILAEQPGAKIIGLSRHEDLGFVRSLLKAGASGYVTKRSVSSERYALPTPVICICSLRWQGR